MKIRHPGLIKTFGFAGAMAVRLWIGTLRCRYRSAGPSVEPQFGPLPRQYIYAIWHENILLPVYRYSRPNMSVIISQHADGELLAEVLRNLRVHVVRGSTTRGGIQAVRSLLRAGPATHLTITPDGPRGPRRRVQSGIIYLAARMDMPIIPVGFGFEQPWRLQSWDRFVLPRPWSLATIVTGALLVVPATADKDQRENYREQLQQSLEAVSQAAQDWAERKNLPGRPRSTSPPAELLSGRNGQPRDGDSHAQRTPATTTLTTPPRAPGTPRDSPYSAHRFAPQWRG